MVNKRGSLDFIRAEKLKLSVIIPSFNSEKKIQRCIESVGQQTYPNVEILVIDGGSTDGTLEILENCKKNFNNLKYISEPDKGIYDAMNKGARLATGDWLYFIGSDDFLYTNAVIEEVFTRQEVTKSDVIYGDVWNEYINSRYDGEFTFEKLAQKFICHQSIFVKRNTFFEYGPYNQKYKVSADMAFTLNVFGNPNVKWSYVDTVVAFYSAGGYSALTYDKLFWNDAEILYLNCFADHVSKKTIYAALEPVIKYDFSLRKAGLLVRIMFYTRSIAFLKYPFHRYYRIGVLTLRKLCK